jgi:predicted phosphodiesterase
MNKLERILIIPDIHSPYHDKKAVDLMLKAAHKFKPHHVLILGDFLDCYTVSSHSKDPRRALKLEEEINESLVLLDRIRDIGAKNNVFIEGNHEDRLKRYLQDKAPELFNFISIPKLLHLKEKGFKFVPYRQSYRLGKLSLTHDAGNAGRFAHYKAVDTFQTNIIIGHTHRIGYAVEGNARNERHVAAMFGWLGNVEKIDYLHRVKAEKDWSLGFGIGYLNKSTGIVYLVTVPIVAGKCLIEGKDIS